MLKKIFFWNYARNTWQWDVLCVVILIFIFLTPKSWLENQRTRHPGRIKAQLRRTVLVGAELVENAEDKSHVWSKWCETLRAARTFRS